MTHILPPDAFYRGRRVVCNQRGYGHRHKTHMEHYTYALCGAEVLKDGGSVNVNIFDPRLKNDWCPGCYKEIADFLKPAG